jgi:hypothetical protein
MIETVRRTSRNVKRWQSGDMCLRWTAAGMLEAERQFRKIIGHTDLAKLAVAVECDLIAQDVASPTADEPLRSSLPDGHTGTVAAKFHDDRDSSSRSKASRTRYSRPSFSRQQSRQAPHRPPDIVVEAHQAVLAGPRSHGSTPDLNEQTPTRSSGVGVRT